MRIAWTALAAAVFAFSSSAAAQDADPTDEGDRVLRGFTRAEADLLAPLLSTGTVCMVEFAPLDQLPAIIIATEIDAPIETVASIVGDPRGYPSFMPALDEVSVETDDASGISYAWAWRAAVFTLRGTNTLQAFTPPAGHPEVGYRYLVRSTGGDLGTGRTVYRLQPRGARTLLTSASRMDLRDANYIARQLAGGGVSVNRSLNIAIAMAMVLRTRMEAERRAGHTRPALAVETGEPERPVADWVAMEGLLHRGDIMWVESGGADLGRVAVAGVVHNPEPAARAAMLDPQGFARGFLAGAHVTTLEESPETGTRFEWGIDLPLIGTSGQMRIHEHSDGLVHMDGVSGALAQARWRFQTTARPYGALVLTWGRFDLSDGLWLVRVISDADPAFRPGLSAGAQLMMVRGLRARLQHGI